MPATPSMGGLVLMAGIMPLILGLLMGVYWNTRKAYPGFGFWVLANFSLGFSYILIGLRTQLSDLLSIVAANALNIFSLVLIYEGMELFFERRRLSVLNYLILGSYVVGQFFFTYYQPNTNHRIVLTSLTAAILNLRVAASALRPSLERLRATSRVIALIFILTALFSLVRAVYAFQQAAPIDVLTDRSLVAVAFASTCSLTAWSFYFLFLNSSRVEMDLESTTRRLGQAADTSRRELAQLALLDEAGQLVAESLDEAQILQRAIDAMVHRFGYAEAAISMLVDDGKLELRAISGTEDLAYQPGYRQSLGEGIIGHVGETAQIYVANDVSQDPYFYTVGRPRGSAAGVPLMNKGELIGVLYVESAVAEAFKKSDLQTLRTLASHVSTAVNKARLYSSTQEHLAVMMALNRISQLITSSLELPRIFQTVLQLLKDTFGYQHIGIYLLDGEVLRLGAQLGYTGQNTFPEIPVSDGIVGRTVQAREAQFVRDASQEPAFLRARRDINSEICVPLLKKGGVLGVINVEGTRRNPLQDRDVEVLTALAGPIAIAVENAQLHAQARALARVDGLTGLMNRRTFDQTLAAELARAIRYEYPLTLIILDLDEFKSINDRWGHPAGDAILREAARLIQATIRGTDSAARYGGDEFAIILPNTSLGDGLELAERLRAGAELMGSRSSEARIPAGDYSFSLGVAAFPSNGRTAEDLLVAADHAELAAKKQGKNRVCAAEVAA